MVELSEKAKQLLDGKNYAHIATLMPDGSPQNTLVWIDRDGDRVLFNTDDRRTKPRNLRADPRVSVSIAAAENPYSWVQIRGRMVEITAEGADAHIDALAKKYLDMDSYPYRTPEDERVIVAIEADAITEM